MTFNIYSEQACENLVAMANVGEYRSAVVSDINRWLSGTTSVDGGTSFAYNWLSALPVSTTVVTESSGNEFLPTNIELTDSEERQYFYLTSTFRVCCYYFKRDGKRWIDNPGFEYWTGSTWERKDGIGSQTIEVANLIGFRLMVCKKNKLRANDGGNSYYNTAGDMLVIDMIVQLVGQSSPTSYRCCSGYAPYENFVIDDTPSYKGTPTARKGGKGVGYYPSNAREPINTAARNTAFTYGSTNGIGITYYEIDRTDYYGVLSKIYSTSVIKEISEKNFGLKDAIVGMYQLPVVPAGVSDVPIRLGSYDTDILAKCITERFVSNEGTSEIELNSRFLENFGWGDFTDFTETQMTIYLPFVGTINLEAQFFMQGKIRLEWIIDVYSGNITYWISGRNINSDKEIIYGIYSGNCAAPIPYAGAVGNFDTLGVIKNVSNAIGHGAKGYLATSSGDPAGIIGGVASMVGAVVDVGKAIAETSQADKTFIVDKSGIVDPKTVTECPYQPFIQVEMPNQVRPEGWTGYLGLSGNSLGQVKDFKGFTIFKDVKIKMEWGTLGEMKELISLLKSGVYLPEGS